jgi:hypothetical protein
MSFMSKEEVDEVMAFVRSVPVPTSTLLCNIAFLESQNRTMWEKLKRAEEVIRFYSNVPRAPFARECDGGAAAQGWLRNLKEQDNG